MSSEDHLDVAARELGKAAVYARFSERYSKWSAVAMGALVPALAVQPVVRLSVPVAFVLLALAVLVLVVAGVGGLRVRHDERAWKRSLSDGLSDEDRGGQPSDEEA